MAATLRRRILVNYRVQPERVEAMLPERFRPVLVDGYAIAGICLIGLSDIRPLGLPAAVGVSSENAAHRVAVEWDGPQGPVRGVYIPRRDTSSLLVALAGGRAFPGWHRRADFDVESRHGRFRLSVVSRDGQVRVDLACHKADDVMAGSVFASVAEASAFFRCAPTGYSATRGGVVLDGVELEATGWKLEPLHVETVASSFFEDRDAFPSGAAVLDSAFVMENLATTWVPKPKVSVTPPTAAGSVGRDGLNQEVSSRPRLVAPSPGRRLDVDRRMGVSLLSVYAKCVKWGIGTGAVTGAMTGATLGLLAGGLADGIVDRLIGLPLAFAGYGAIVGALVAIVPTALGGLIVTEVVERRHPHPCSPDAVRGEVGVIFAVLVGLLDAALLVVLVSGSDDASSIVRELPLVAVANACVAFMLWNARESIVHEWSGSRSTSV